MPRGLPASTPTNLNAGRRTLAQPAKANVGQTYGEAGKQIQSQRVQPLPDVQGTRTLPRQMPPPTEGPAPGQVIGLNAPSLRPDEPVTAGLSIGPGRGPEILNSVSPGNMELSVMRAIWGKYPNEDLRRLIEWAENNPE